MSRILCIYFLPLLLFPDVAGAEGTRFFFPKQSGIERTKTKKGQSKMAKRARGSTIVRIAPAGTKFDKKLETELQLELRSKAHAVN